MLQVVESGNVFFLTRDAIAVQNRHQFSAVKTIINVWADAVGCAVKTKVKVDSFSLGAA